MAKRPRNLTKPRPIFVPWWPEAVKLEALLRIFDFVETRKPKIMGCIKLLCDSI